jgi:hypothetical protein
MGKAQMATSQGASSNAVPALNSLGIVISGRISSGILSKFWVLYAHPMLEPSILMKAGSLFSSLRFPTMAAKKHRDRLLELVCRDKEFGRTIDAN